MTSWTQGQGTKATGHNSVYCATGTQKERENWATLHPLGHCPYKTNLSDKRKIYFFFKCRKSGNRVCVKTTGWWNLGQGKTTGHGIILLVKITAEITVPFTLYLISTWLILPHPPAFSLAVTSSRKPSQNLKVRLGPLSYVPPASYLPSL